MDDRRPGTEVVSGVRAGDRVDRVGPQLAAARFSPYPSDKVQSRLVIFTKPAVNQPDPYLASVKSYLLGLQTRIVEALEAIDGKPFLKDVWQRPEGGGGISRLIEEGNVLERGGVGFSHVTGRNLPPSAAANRPELAGRRWEAMGVSLVLHPRNP